jgi:hypothetical protein
MEGDKDGDKEAEGLWLCEIEGDKLGLRLCEGETEGDSLTEIDGLRLWEGLTL